MRTVLVLSGGTEAVPGIERVRDLGVRVAVLDGNPDAPGLALADERLEVSTYDVQGCVAAARKLHERTPLSGVLSIAADVPHTVAAVARELGLPGLSEETAHLAMDKLAMKRRFREAGVPIPWFAEVRSAVALIELLEQKQRTLVIKPVDSRGARGVLRLTPDVDPVFAFEHAFAQSPTGRVMVEEFLEGPQLSTESMIVDDRAVTLGCSDRNYEYIERFAPYLIENGGCQPTAFLEDVRDEVDRVVLAAARAIGVDGGVLKGDLVLHPERGPIVIEVAPRLSGGWFCTDQIPWSTGVDLVQAQARWAMGEPLSADELEPQHFKPIAVRYFFPPPGVVRSIEGAVELARQRWVQRLVLFVQPGDTLDAVTDHTRRAGLVITTGTSRQEAIGLAEEAVRAVHFEIAGAATEVA